MGFKHVIQNPDCFILVLAHYLQLPSTLPLFYQWIQLFNQSQQSYGCNRSPRTLS